jgi:uncharacterized membrane protein YgcG
VLIIVLWITFGLVSLALYFAGSMSFEQRAADQRVARVQAETAIEGMVRYLTYLLSNQITNGSNGITLEVSAYPNAAVPIGDCRVWLISRDTNLVTTGPGKIAFGLLDESSRLNLNTVTSNQMMWLPTMTVDLANGILDWRSTNGPGTTLSYYATMQPPYFCKNDPFETVDELRLVYGADMDALIGEDYNRNGILDPTETDANQNNMLDPGVLEYFTVYSNEPAATGAVNLASVSYEALYGVLSTNLSASRAAEICSRLGLSPTGGATTGGRGGGTGGTGRGGTGRGSTSGGGRSGGATTTTTTASFTSPLQFYIRSGLTSTEFSQVATNFSMGTTNVQGRVNVNSAGEVVLTCLLNGDDAGAQTLISYRQNNPNNLTSIAWVADALQGNTQDLDALAAGDYITVSTYQYTADIAALGPHGRGYRRIKFVFDTSSGSVRILYRQDLTHLGWALGEDVRKNYVLADNPK